MTTTDPPTRAGTPPTPGRRLPLAAELPVLGIPVRFETTSPAILAAVEEAYGAWRSLGARPGLLAAAPARARIVLLLRADEAGDVVRHPHRAVGPEPGRLDAEPSLAACAGAPACLETHVERSRLRLAAGDAAGHADAGRMEAVARVAPGLPAEPIRFREVVDTLVLFLLTRLDRQPVHSAAIAGGGAGLVLAGGSGAGKSTLAYAALRAGLRVLTEDAAYVQLDPRLRVWGMGRGIHLTPEAATRFPELAGRAEVLRANGKRKVHVAAATAAGDGPPVVERAGVCVLERGPGAVACEPITPEAAVARLTRRLDPGFDVFRDSIGARLHALAAGGAWRLRLSEDPGEAVPRLVEMLERVAGWG